MPNASNLERRWSRHVGSSVVIACTLVLALAMMAWLGFDLSHFSRATFGDPGDTLLENYTLYQATDNLLHRPLDLGYSQIFAGEHNSFAMTTATYGIAIFMLPLSVIVGPGSPIVYNVYFVLTFVLTAWSIYLLLRYLFQTHQLIAFFIAVMIAFSPIRQRELPRVQELSLQFVIFSIYCLHRLLDRPRKRWVIGLGIATGLTVIASGYLGAALAILLLIIALYAFLRRKSPWSAALVRALIVAVLICAVLIAPFIAMRYGNSRFRRGQNYDQIQFHSASFASWVAGASLLYHDLLDYHAPSNLFPGFVPIGLALTGVWLWRRKRSVFVEGERVQMPLSQRELISLYILIAAVGYFLTLGPEIKVTDSAPPLTPSPYLLLLQLPGFSSLRSSARFITLPLISIGILSAFTLGYLRLIWKRGFWVFFAVLSVFMVFELVPAIGESSHRITNASLLPLNQRFYPARDYKTDQPVDLWLAQQPSEIPILNYPVDGNGVFDYYNSLPIHHHAMIEGPGTALIPDWIYEYDWVNFPNRDIMNLLLERGVGYIILHREYLSADTLAAFEDRWATIQSQWSTLPEVARFGDVSVYQVTAPPAYGSNPQHTAQVIHQIRADVRAGRCFEASVTFEQNRTANIDFPMSSADLCPITR